MTNLFYAEIVDYRGTVVLQLEFTATAKHSAFLASKFIEHCPPAQGFNIRKTVIKTDVVARLMNERRS